MLLGIRVGGRYTDGDDADEQADRGYDAGLIGRGLHPVHFLNGKRGKRNGEGGQRLKVSCTLVLRCYLLVSGRRDIGSFGGIPVGHYLYVKDRDDYYRFHASSHVSY
jgi:hypothetical protein